jgi:hypothetical protein
MSHPEQYAGKKKHDSLFLNYVLCEQIWSNASIPCWLALLDVEGAFPRTWAKALRYLLWLLGTQLDLLKLLKDIHGNRKSAIKVGGKLTEFFRVKGGIAEGSPNSVDFLLCTSAP